MNAGNGSRRRAKIVCTVGPASWTAEGLRSLIESGMDVARLNFSHGTQEEKARTIETIQELRRSMDVSVGILQDLCGPKIRVGKIDPAGLRLARGATVALSADPPPEGTHAGVPLIPVSYGSLLDDVPPGSRILMDDGRIEVEVTQRKGALLFAEVIHEGVLLPSKGVNFPGIRLSQRVPTERDEADLRFGIEHGVDFVALSFVQNAEDVSRARKIVTEAGSDVALIAKLERQSAIDDLDAILSVSDGVMVARGDLGIETAIEQVPVYQKLIVEKANERGVFVITATQMLGSMVVSPTPTRAEVSDVANAIFDGTDAMMLSEETAVGKYPSQAVATMARIALAAESADTRPKPPAGARRAEDDEALIARSACATAEGAGARVIVAHTLSGKTARLVSRYRPRMPIIAVTPRESSYYRLSMAWGVRPFLLAGEGRQFVDSISRSEELLLERGIIEKGDAVVYTGGMPSGVGGGTNVIKIARVASR